MDTAEKGLKDRPCGLCSPSAHNIISEEPRNKITSPVWVTYWDYYWQRADIILITNRFPGIQIIINLILYTWMRPIEAEGSEETVRRRVRRRYKWQEASITGGYKWMIVRRYKSHLILFHNLWSSPCLSVVSLSYVGILLSSPHVIRASVIIFFPHILGYLRFPTDMIRWENINDIYYTSYYYYSYCH